MRVLAVNICMAFRWIERSITEPVWFCNLETLYFCDRLSFSWFNDWETISHFPLKLHNRGDGVNLCFRCVNLICEQFFSVSWNFKINQKTNEKCEKPTQFMTFIWNSVHFDLSSKVQVAKEYVRMCWLRDKCN